MPPGGAALPPHLALPSARATCTARLTPLSSSAPRSSRGPGRTTCSSGTGRRSPRPRSCWRMCEPPCRWVAAFQGSHVPPVHPIPSTGTVVSGLRDTQGREATVMELPRAMGKTTSRGNRGGGGGGGARVTPPATYGRRSVQVTLVSTDLGTFHMESQLNQRHVTKR